MKSVSFRLSESDVELLERLAEQQGVSKTQYIRDALQKADNAIQDAVQEKQSENIPDSVLDVLTEQLRVKDEQIRDLNRALERAQTLHHEEREPKVLETAEAKKTMQQRFKEWWVGK